MITYMRCCLKVQYYICALIITLQVADFDIEAAQRGIVYLDEVDKITKKVWEISTIS